MPVLPELWGGSADLAESNNTTPKGEPSFIPTEHQTKEFPGGPYGRVLHFGIREHAMGSIINGITLHGLTRLYGGTFLVFSDYMRPAVRLAALMKLPVTYVWTHDSIGLGEDGPTHQPIEHLAALRAIPGLDVVRPADANETAVAWKTILSTPTGRPGSCLTRQNVPTFDRSATRRTAPPRGRRRPRRVRARRGGREADAGRDHHRHRLGGLARRRGTEAAGGRGRCHSCGVHAVPGVVLRAGRRVPAGGAADRREGPGSVEAAVAQGWRDLVGDAGETVSIEHFGASAAYTTLFEQFGFTPDHVVAAAHASLERAGRITGTTTGT